MEYLVTVETTEKFRKMFRVNANNPEEAKEVLQSQLDEGRGDEVKSERTEIISFEMTDVKRRFSHQDFEEWSGWGSHSNDIHVQVISGPNKGAAGEVVGWAGDMGVTVRPYSTTEWIYEPTSNLKVLDEAEIEKFKLQ